jgi:hypothetical protein
MRLHSWISGVGLPLLAACGGGGGPDRPPAAPPETRQYVVVVDLSGSITAQERSSNQDLLAAFTGTLGFGDRLVVMDAHARGRRDTRPPLVLEIPAPVFGGQPTADDSLTRAEAARMAQPLIQQVLAAPVANGTDLFATLHSVAERVREAPGRKSTLVLMSDMLQCAGEVCMEREGGIPDSTFVASLKSRGALPRLDGTCVVVVGADASTFAGQRARDFWIDYFEAAGAQLRPEKYSYQVIGPESLVC